MPIRTLDIDALAQQVGNVYEAVAILSKRARQIASKQKAELSERLEYFDGFEREYEDLRMKDEQVRVSLEFEKRPKPAISAIDELLDHEIYYRTPDKEEL